MAIKINWKDLQKRIINWKEVSKVMLNWTQIRPSKWREYDIDISNFKSTTSYSWLSWRRAWCFSMDWMKYYVSQGNATLNEYTLNNKYDLSSASETHSLTAGWEVHQVYISPDWRHLWCVTYYGSTYLRELTTPNDITTATNLQISWSFYRAVGMWFKPDWTRMYIWYFNSNGIRQYDLSTPWDITTETDVWELVTYAERWVTLSSDWTVLIRCDDSNTDPHALYQITLSTPRDITSATQIKGISESFGSMFALTHDDSRLVSWTSWIWEFYKI